MRMNDQYADLARWEKTIKRKDEELRQQQQQQAKARTGARRVVPVRGGGGGSGGSRGGSVVRTRMGGGAVSVPIEELQRQQGRRAAAAAAGGGGGGGGSAAAAGSTTKQSAADHTYDKGYNKWEKFDVEKALQEVEVEDITASEAVGGGRAGGAGIGGPDSVGAVPAHVVSGDSAPEGAEPVYVARTRQPIRQATPAGVAEVFEAERKKGNGHFGRGEFADAIRCYTKCIGYDSRNPIVYSNRAAAYLKTKECVALTRCVAMMRCDARYDIALLSVVLGVAVGTCWYLRMRAVCVVCGLAQARDLPKPSLCNILAVRVMLLSV